jgi:hypothetical protein
VGLHKFVVHS